MKTGFLYFREGKAIVNPKDLGLAYAFDGDTIKQPLPGEATPSGKEGVLFGDSRIVSRRIGYAPQNQTWRKIPRNDCWIGMWNDAVPGPTELLRREIIPGNEVKLCDGHKWIIPLVRDNDNGTQLPVMMDVDEKGKWFAGGFKPGHDHLFNQCMEFLQFAVKQLVDMTDVDEEDTVEDDEVTIAFQFDDLIPVAVQCIETNYRVSDIEIAMLKLFDNSSATQVLCAATDWEEFMRRISLDKKKADSSTDAIGNTNGGKTIKPSGTSRPVLT